MRWQFGLTHVAVGMALAIAVVLSSSVSGSTTDHPLAIQAGALVDVVRGRLVHDAVVIVEAGRIAAAGPRAAVKVPPHARHLRLGDTTLLPGLIDAHVHLTLGGVAESNARATLEAGFTTVQDLGAQRYENVQLRDAINAGRVAGPRIMAAGPWLGVSGGICDFDGIGVKGPNAFRARVNEDVRRGVDLIKVCVSGWLTDAVRKPEQYEISNEELQVAIDEAHRSNRRVAVHALSAAGIAAAVDRGADLVAHAGFPSPLTVETMRRRGVYLLPTLFALTGRAASEEAAAVQSHLRTAFKNGLPIAFGTDAGVIPHGQNAREFEHLAAIGLSPAEAIKAATIGAATAVGLKGRVGVLERGAFADVIAVDGDPLADLTALQRVRFVMRDGKVIRGPVIE